MRYYFAGAYARRAELAGYAPRLQAAAHGSVIVSRWLFQDQTGEDAGFTADGLVTPGAITRAWSYAQRDLEDLSVCDAIVSFTGQGGRGGRHIEHGAAIVYRTEHPWLGNATEPFRLIIVGPREHVFHCHPDTEVFGDFEAFLKHETGRSAE
jgi:hypothetical protein